MNYVDDTSNCYKVERWKLHDLANSLLPNEELKLNKQANKKPQTNQEMKKHDANRWLRKRKGMKAEFVPSSWLSLAFTWAVF